MRRRCGRSSRTTRVLMVQGAPGAASSRACAWMATAPNAIATVTRALSGSELLIADGHHRYETARVYAEEVGGEGDHRYVMMCLVALEDPGLTVFATHRLLRDLSSAQQEALATTIRREFEIAELDSTEALAPVHADPVRIGYIDAHFRRPFMLSLRDQATADAALRTHAEPYPHLHTAPL